MHSIEHHLVGFVIDNSEVEQLWYMDVALSSTVFIFAHNLVGPITPQPGHPCVSRYDVIVSIKAKKSWDVI